MLGEKRSVVIALINGEKVPIDVASKNRDAYPDVEKEYLGYGTYFTINGVKQLGKEKVHFFRFKHLPL